MELDADVQDDSYYDPLLGMTISRSGRERARRLLAERARPSWRGMTAGD